MKLYGFPPSPNTWKVRAVAAHVSVPLELALVDLSKGQQRTPEYLALNPTGRTPTLVDGDLVLWESTAIMHYLANQKPNSLWPSNPRARADIMRWQSWQLQHWSKEGASLSSSSGWSRSSSISDRPRSRWWKRGRNASTARRACSTLICRSGRT